LENKEEKLITYSEKFIVNTYDIDAAGHVNNIVNIRWIENLRNGIFDSIYPVQKLLENKLYPVVVSTDAKYKRQIKLSDKPVGIIELSAFHHGIYTFNITVKVESNIVFTAVQKCVIINLTENKMISKYIKDYVLRLAET